LYKHLTVEQRRLALRLHARGMSLREIGPQVGCSYQGLALIVRDPPRRPVPRDAWVPGPGRLTLADREEITLGVHAGESFAVIARRLGRAVSTVSREVAANGGRDSYRAWRAHQRAREQARSAFAGSARTIQRDLQSLPCLLVPYLGKADLSRQVAGAGVGGRGAAGW
jgi:IS30 family transposase